MSNIVCIGIATVAVFNFRITHTFVALLVARNIDIAFILQSNSSDNNCLQLSSLLIIV